MAKPKTSSRKPVKKKTAPKKAPAKKKVAAKRKVVAKKAAPKKKVAAKKTAPKKKVAARKAAPKKAAPKKAAPKPVAKKAAPSKPAQAKADLAKKVARDVQRATSHEPRAFIEGKITTDALAEEMGEDTVLAITTGEDEQGARDGERVAAVGGPFVVSSSVE